MAFGTPLGMNARNLLWHGYCVSTASQMPAPVVVFLGLVLCSVASRVIEIPVATMSTPMPVAAVAARSIEPMMQVGINGRGTAPDATGMVDTGGLLSLSSK